MFIFVSNLEALLLFAMVCDGNFFIFSWIIGFSQSDIFSILYFFDIESTCFGMKIGVDTFSELYDFYFGVFNVLYDRNFFKVVYYVDF